MELSPSGLISHGVGDKGVCQPIVFISVIINEWDVYAIARDVIITTYKLGNCLL